MDVSTTLIPHDARLRITLTTPPSPLFPLLLAAAGMMQRWRQQSQQACKLGRARYAQVKAEAARRERDRLPRASRARSAATARVTALECTALALRADAAGDRLKCAEQHAEAAWFADHARRLSAFSSILLED